MGIIFTTLHAGSRMEPRSHVWRLWLIGRFDEGGYNRFRRYGRATFVLLHWVEHVVLDYEENIEEHYFLHLESCTVYVRRNSERKFNTRAQGPADDYIDFFNFSIS